MSIAPTSRHDRSQVSGNLARASRWMSYTGIEKLVAAAEAEAGTNPRGAGRKPISNYTLMSVLITMAEMVLSGVVVSVRNVIHRMTFVYSDDELHLLGPGFTRNADRVAAMRAAAAYDPEAGASAVPADLREAYRLWCCEYERGRKKILRLFDIFDDTPLPSDRAWTANEINEAAKKVDPRKTRLRDEIANRIVVASLRLKNEQFFPNLKPENLLDGVLRDYRGDLASDQTPIDVSIVEYQDVDNEGERRHSVVQLARFAPKNRRMEYPASVGLNLAIAASHLDGRRVPNVALGMALSHPKSADGPATLIAVDAVEQHGNRPERTGNTRQHFIADNAYPNMLGFNSQIRDRGYHPLFKYKKNDRPVVELRAWDNDLKTEVTTANLILGVPVCPGVPTTMVPDTGWLNPPPRQHDPDGLPYDPEKLHRHQQRVADLASKSAGPHGHPFKSTDKKPGRPVRGAPAPKPVHKMRLTCPALEGLIKCALRQDADSWTDPDLGEVLAPPALPTPLCKAKSNVTVTLSDRAVKHLQPEMAGSWDHQDHFGGVRARNEAFHSLLIRPEVGGLRRGQVTMRKNSSYTIAVALHVGVTNIAILDRWHETLDRKTGEAPWEAHVEQRKIRANILDRRAA